MAYPGEHRGRSGALGRIGGVQEGRQILRLAARIGLPGTRCVIGVHVVNVTVNVINVINVFIVVIVVTSVHAVRTVLTVRTVRTVRSVSAVRTVRAMNAVNVVGAVVLTTVSSSSLYQLYIHSTIPSLSPAAPRDPFFLFLKDEFTANQEGPPNR